LHVLIKADTSADLASAAGEFAALTWSSASCSLVLEPAPATAEVNRPETAPAKAEVKRPGRPKKVKADNEAAQV